MKKVRQIVFGWVWLLAAVGVLVGCQTSPPPDFSSSFDLSNDPLFVSDPLSGDSTNSPVLYPFKPEDFISVSFIGPDPTPIPPVEGRVSEDGTITLPLVGQVKVAGKTASQVEKEIHKAYVPQYYVRLTVIVRGQDRVYYVGGEVKAPNRYVWAGEITLTKAIQTAGDFTDWAKKKKVTITRAGKTMGPYNCVKILEGKASDPQVQSSDKIYVPRRTW